MVKQSTMLQTQRLGKYLATHRNLHFTRIYASDLQRAYMTAEEIRRHQSAQWSATGAPEVVRLPVLREKDFGSFELVPWASQRAQNALDPRVPNPQDPSFRPQETSEAMKLRADTFVADFILPLATSLWATEPEFTNECVAVVSHGLFLAALWKSLLAQFNTGTVVLGPNIEVLSYGRPLEYLPSWNNTAFLELTIRRAAADAATDTAAQVQPAQTQHSDSMPFYDCSMTVHAINGRDHLLDLKRARGGIGSAAYDAKQKSLDGFFKRPKDDSAPGSAG
ncbi:hypothetical protein LTR10_018037 [Elasticomyces elasticus]|uniref:Phosphoglycerate mutase n=1 Tax=Exophiala sideris TaxID=1016849 RepID=A0ABR0JRI3_9EURO|nr:hypothetical protein LTR10_018037 [Elasticomyces elasticus]KAK5039559.1 hypothetical protein LTS07_000053 [Exophiala sideris]KAK5041112.1 hypothetical protein LTR13_002586 [Exophiala sideris]KAK5067936.1 hypothetical protein LTR69_000053 [Exophiala sideris]KAK5187238.1 hypothetical protein LTR44_000053 [Eurotiomycetes sp. CCFEE 6388]